LQPGHAAATPRGFEGGLTLILMGFYMLNAVMFWMPELAI